MDKIEVELPDGSIVDFPAGTSDEEMNRAIQDFLSSQGGQETPAVPATPAPPSGVDTMPDLFPDLTPDLNQNQPIVNPFGIDFEAQQQAYRDRLEEREIARRQDEERRLQERMMGNPSTPFRADVLYGEQPPRAPVLDRVLGAVSDASDAISFQESEPNRFQTSRDEANRKREAWLRQAEDTYETLGVPVGDQSSEYVPQDPYSQMLSGPEAGISATEPFRVAEMAIPDPDSEDGYRIETFRIPHPRSGTFQNVFLQALARNVGEYGDLFTEGAITREGEFSQSIPRMQLTDGQQIGSDILSFVMPGLLIDQLVGKGMKAARFGTRSTNVARFGAGAVGEAINTNEDDSPLAVNPARISEVFKGVSQERAEDVAMVADALLVNGAFNGVLRVVQGVAGFAGRTGKGLAAGFSGNLRREVGEREATMRVLQFIDPKIASFGEDQLIRNLQTFSTIIDQNKTIRVVFGEVKEDIPVATVNSLMRGASDYIRVAHAPARKSMSPEQWSEYINSEAALMVNRMIGLTGAEAGAGQAVATRQAEISTAVRDVMDRGAAAQLPAGVSSRQAMGDATDSLMDVRRADIAAADDEILRQTGRIEEATSALSTVASDNQIIRELLDGTTPPTEFFREGPFVERMKTLMGDELFTAYRTTFDNVDRAYAAIPNTPLSPEGITAFQSVLDDVVQNANQIDSSGGTARNILGRVYNAFQPQRSMDSSGNVVIETAEELIERMGSVGFQDMYVLKQQLSRVIDSQAQGPVRERLIELRRHITDGDSGQIAILRETGDSATATAAEAADQAFREAMARFNNSEPMRQFSNLAGTNRAVGGTFDTVQGAARRGEPDMVAQGVNNILPQITNDPTGAYFENFALALDTVMSRGQIDEVMSQRVTSEALYNLGTALRNQDNQGAAMIMDAIRPHARELERFNPGLLDTIERAAGQVSQDARALTSVVDEATGVLNAAKAARTEAENSILRRFVNPEGTNVEAISNPRGVLLNMMTSNNAGNEYRALMDQIARIPDPADRAFAEQALRATTIENISERLFSTASGAMVSPTEASRGVSMANVQRILSSNGNNILDVIDTVFANSDPIKEHYRIILRNLATDELPRAVKFRLYGSDTASQLNIAGAASTTILMWAGYMNPTAAAARRLSSDFVNAAEQDLQRVSKETLVNFLSYPEEAARLTEVLMRSRDPGVIAQALSELTAATGRGIRAELRTSEDPRGMVAEEVINRTIGPTPEENNLDAQSEDLFGR